MMGSCESLLANAKDSRSMRGTIGDVCSNVGGWRTRTAFGEIVVVVSDPTHAAAAKVAGEASR